MHYCIVGCGRIAQTHARLLKKLENFVPGNRTRFSFASRDKNKVREYRKKFGGELVFDSYAEAFASKEIDVAVICTPNDSHRPLALAALEQGKHVIIEKPIARTTAEADEILAEARKRDRHVLVAENHRYRPHTLRLEPLVRSGCLGVVKMIRINVMRTHRFKPDEWRASFDQMGGGPLIDGGIHWVNVLLTLGGSPVTAVSAYEPPTTLENCPGEDSIVITTQFQGGAVGILTYSWGIRGSFPIRFFSVHGSEGSIYCSNSGVIGLMKCRFWRPLMFSFRDNQGYRAMWQEFLLCLAKGNCDQSLATGDIGRRDLAFIESTYQNLKTARAPI